MLRKNTQSGFIEALAMIIGLVMSVTLLSLNSARAKSRDAKRIADIRQIAAALELYYNDIDSYPAELIKMTPTYIGVIPAPPQPSDGTCTIEQNKYVYQKFEKDKYQLTFCLGQPTSGYLGGPHTLTQAGIQ